MSDAEEYLDKKVINAKYTDSEMDLVILEKDAWEAVRLARKEGQDKYDLLQDMFPDKDTSEFESDGVKFFPQYRFNQEHVRVRLETAKEIFKELEILMEDLKGMPLFTEDVEHIQYIELKKRFLYPVGHKSVKPLSDDKVKK